MSAFLTISHRATRAIALAGLLLGSVPAGADAQERPRSTESNNAELRQRCLARAVSLNSAARIRNLSESQRHQALDIRQCHISAGAVLPAAWSRAIADSVELSILIAASSPIRDKRIADELERILADETKENLIRQAPAVVLTTYVLPGEYRGIVRKDDSRGDRWSVGIIGGSHVTFEDGPVPIDPGLRERLVALVERARASSPTRTGNMYPLTGLLLRMLER